MSKKILSVIDTAYRAAQEEQDDAGLWFSAAVHNSGLNVDILLTGNAVNYAVKGHRIEPIKTGGGVVPHPFNPNGDIERMAAKGANFLVVGEDLAERGIDSSNLTNCVEQISREKVADLLDSYDSIWHW